MIRGRHDKELWGRWAASLELAMAIKDRRSQGFERGTDAPALDRMCTVVPVFRHEHPEPMG